MYAKNYLLHWPYVMVLECYVIFGNTLTSPDIFVICFSAEKDYDIMLKSKVKEGGQKVLTFIM